MTPLSLFMSRFVPLLRRLRLVSRCAVVALVLVAALTMSSGLAACSGAGAAAGATAPGAARASARPTRSAAASPSPSDLPTLSPELEALREEALGMEEPEPLPEITQVDEFGATAAAVYFMDLYRYAFLTGDTAPVERMSDEECVFCNSTIQDAHAVHDAGWWAEPWTQEFMGSQVWPVSGADDAFRVDLKLSVGEIVQRDPYGLEERRFAAETQSVAVLVHQTSGNWMVLACEVLGE